MKFMPIIFTLIILQCSSCLANSREYYAGVLALVAVQKTDSIDPVKCQCNGSGRSGDGLSVCQCVRPSPVGLSDCKCRKESQPFNDPFEIDMEPPEFPQSEPLTIRPPKTQLLFFSTANCGPCEMVKSEFEKMKRTGWKIDTSRTAHIISSDQAGQFGVHSFPCFIRMVNGQEVIRSYGYMNSYSILDFYNGVTQ